MDAENKKNNENETSVLGQACSSAFIGKSKFRPTCYGNGHTKYYCREESKDFPNGNQTYSGRHNQYANLGKVEDEYDDDEFTFAATEKLQLQL